MFARLQIVTFCPQRYKVTQTLPVNPFPAVAAAAAEPSSTPTVPSSSSSSSSSSAAAATATSHQAQLYDDDVWVLPHPEKIIKRAAPCAPLPKPAPVPAALGRPSAYCSVPSCTKKSRYLLSVSSAYSTSNQQYRHTLQGGWQVQ